MAHHRARAAPPRQVAGGRRATITDTFIGQGDHTSFRREFELGPVLGAQQPLPYTSDTARAENANVKALVEKILWREQKGRNLL